MLSLLQSAISNRRLILQLIKRDIILAQHGSVLGALWVFIDPLVYITLTLVFFQFAIKGIDTSGVPYVAWVLPQIILWTFATGAITSSVGMVKEFSFLLRHRHFDMRLIMLIKIGSAAFVHCIMMAVVMIVLLFFFGVRVGWQTLAVFYYFFAMCTLIIALGWLFSALGAFWKDVRSLVAIMLQVGFWMSPIFWEPSRFPAPVAFIMYLNPFFYPINGYRKSLLLDGFGVSFPIATLYFWGVVGLLLFFCSRVFRRMSNDFGDVVYV
jgi:ABC-type polysaccharide/polyol phosphate export permease